MSRKAQTRDHATELFKGFAGQGNSLVIPRPYIDFCKGDHLAALLLSQILYWADRTDDPDGWFAKTYDEWYRELAMTEYQVRHAIKGDKRSKARSFSLESVGIETTLRKSKFHHGAATLHYRVDQTMLRKSVAAFMSDLNNVEDTPQTMFRSLPQQRSERSTETIAETTTKKNPAAQAPPPDVPVEDPAPAVQPHIALIDAYWAGLPGGKPAADTYPRHVELAAKIVEAGRLTPEHITHFMRVVYGDTPDSAEYKYWRAKVIPFEEVEKLAGVYFATHPLPRPIHIDMGDETVESMWARGRAASRRKFANGELDQYFTDEERAELAAQTSGEKAA